MQKLRDMQSNPALSATAFSDPRMIQVIGVLMGVDLQAFEKPEGTAEKGAFDPTNPEGGPAPAAAPSLPAAAASSSSAPKASPAPSAPKAKPSAPEPTPAAASEPMDVDPSSSSSSSAQAEAEAVKKEGNEAYKARRFDEAIEKYEKAWELFPKDISFLTNLAGTFALPRRSCRVFNKLTPCSFFLAAVFYEQGEFDKAIATCEKAADEGRELRADYKMIAKCAPSPCPSHLRAWLSDLSPLHNQGLRPDGHVLPGQGRA